MELGAEVGGKEVLVLGYHHPFEIANGHLKLPTRPGLGSDLIEEQLLKHPAVSYPGAR